MKVYKVCPSCNGTRKIGDTHCPICTRNGQYDPRLSVFTAPPRRLKARVFQSLYRNQFGYDGARLARREGSVSGPYHYDPASLTLTVKEGEEKETVWDVPGVGVFSAYELGFVASLHFVALEFDEHGGEEGLDQVNLLLTLNEADPEADIVIEPDGIWVQDGPDVIRVRSFRRLEGV